MWERVMASLVIAVTPGRRPAAHRALRSLRVGQRHLASKRNGGHRNLRSSATDMIWASQESRLDDAGRPGPIRLSRKRRKSTATPNTATASLRSMRMGLTLSPSFRVLRMLESTTLLNLQSPLPSLRATLRSSGSSVAPGLYVHCIYVIVRNDISEYEQFPLSRQHIDNGCRAASPTPTERHP